MRGRAAKAELLQSPKEVSSAEKESDALKLPPTLPDETKKTGVRMNQLSYEETSPETYSA